MRYSPSRFCAWLLLTIVSGVQLTAGADEGADLAQKLANPIASLISVPIQVNYDDNLGLDDKGTRITTNIQPVIPFELNDDWNLITRTIVPLISQDDVIPGEGSQSGLGDINMSLFFSPKKPTESGFILGRGTRILVTDRDRRFDWQRKMERRPGRGRADHTRTLDGGHAGQSRLVGSRRR